MSALRGFMNMLFNLLTMVVIGGPKYIWGILVEVAKETGDVVKHGHPIAEIKSGWSSFRGQPLFTQIAMVVIVAFFVNIIYVIQITLNRNFRYWETGNEVYLGVSFGCMILAPIIWHLGDRAEDGQSNYARYLQILANARADLIGMR